MVISVCVGSSCHLKGSHPIIQELKRLIALEGKADSIELKASFCTNNCQDGVCMNVDGNEHKHVTPDNVEEIFYRVLADGAAN